MRTLALLLSVSFACRGDSVPRFAPGALSVGTLGDSSVLAVGTTDSAAGGETGLRGETGETASRTDTGGSSASNDPPGPSPGCGRSPPPSGNVSFDHRGIARTYTLQVPTGYDPSSPTPLIFAFHGWGGSEEDYLSSPALLSETDARGYLLVAPRGLGSGPPDRSLNSWAFAGSTTGLDGDGVNPSVLGDSVDVCQDERTPDYTYPSCTGIAANGCSWTHCQDDDVAFVLALLDSLAEQLCVDPVRVFATGGSNGGMFSWHLAQDERSAQRVRAVAPLIGLPHRGYLQGPGRGGDLPVLLITGTADRTVPPGDWDDPSFTVTSDGDRFYYTGAAAITQVFATHHGCSAEAPAVAFDVGDALTDCRSYCADDVGWPRVLDCRREMGHTYDFPWTWPLILDFFDQQT